MLEPSETIKQLLIEVINFEREKMKNFMILLAVIFTCNVFFNDVSAETVVLVELNKD